eukprot:m.197123 g.197123  ORF g.197123 m.197123 type:complete len:405 (-) comp18709_c0_seq2:117-1331(-)
MFILLYWVLLCLYCCVRSITCLTRLDLDPDALAAMGDHRNSIAPDTTSTDPTTAGDEPEGVLVARMHVDDAIAAVDSANASPTRLEPTADVSAASDDVSTLGDDSVVDDHDSEWEEIRVGDKVLVNNKKIGTVRYKGTTEFRPGVTLYGIQLLNPEGKHNGTIGTRTYFRCRPKHGTFAPRRRLKLLHPDDVAETERLLAAAAAPAEPKRPKRTAPEYKHYERGTTLAPSPFSPSTMSAKGSFSSHEGFARAPDRFTRNHPSRSPNGTPTLLASRSTESLYKSTESLNIRREKDLKSSADKSPTVARKRKDISAATKEAFKVGVRVLAKGQMGVVKYIGQCHLGAGVWIGIELQGPKATHVGEHSGTVDGKKYFKCARGQGLLLSAPQVSWHGHRVSRILAQSA